MRLEPLIAKLFYIDERGEGRDKVYSTKDMEDCRYVRAAEVAEMIGVSRAKAYKMVAQMNEELKAKNYLVISGRVPRKYLMEKLYQ